MKTNFMEFHNGWGMSLDSEYNFELKAHVEQSS